VLRTTDRLPKLAVSFEGMNRVALVSHGKSLYFGDPDVTSYSFETRPKWGRPLVHNYATLSPPLPTEAQEHLNGSGRRVVLFEVDKWEQMRAPPRPALEDPAVLKHLAGPLWGVLYTWDLTPLEKDVLRRVQHELP